jgi:ATP-dependent exoDNAse (exonuclease V) beta subunit
VEETSHGVPFVLSERLSSFSQVIIKTAVCALKAIDFYPRNFRRIHVIIKTAVCALKAIDFFTRNN